MKKFLEDNIKNTYYQNIAVHTIHRGKICILLEYLHNLGKVIDIKNKSLFVHFPLDHLMSHMQNIIKDKLKHIILKVNILIPYTLHKNPYHLCNPNNLNHTISIHMSKNQL